MSSMSTRFDYIIYVDMDWYAVGRHKSGELEFFVVTGLYTLLQLSIAYSIAIKNCILYCN